MSRAAALALGAIAGALFASRVGATESALLACLSASLCLGGWWGRRPSITAGAAGAALVLTRATVAATLLAGPVSDGLAVPDGEHWLAEVVTVSAPGDGKQRAVLILRPDGPETTDGAAKEDASAADQYESAPTRAWAQLPRYPAVAPGDHISFTARLEPAPEEAGFGEYLSRLGVPATVRVHQFQMVGPPGGPTGWLEQARRTGGRILAETIPAPQSGLAAGILIGLRDLVDREVAENFTASGLSHVVAISGWNIAIVSGVIAAVLGGLPKRPRSLLVVLVIAVYTLVAGGSPSVVRAAIMGGIVLLARESGRAGRASAALGLAAVTMLLIDPAIVDDAGFRLSVAATAGLLAWGSPVTAQLRRRLPSRVPDWLVESLGVSLAAQAATLPLVLADFGRLSLVAPLANLFVAPLVAPAMLAGLLALICGWLVSLGVPAVMGAVAGTAAWASLGLIIGIADVSAALPYASVELAPPFHLVGASVAALGIVICGTRRGRGLIAAFAGERGRSTSRGGLTRSPAPTGAHEMVHATESPGFAFGDHDPFVARLRGASGARPRAPGRLHPGTRILAGTVAAALLGVVLLAGARPDGRFTMTVLDVGQGDAILLQGDRGARVLVDTGPDPDRLLRLLDARVPPWDRRLDLVVLTHPHEDHVAGLGLLLERYRVAGIAEPGMVGAGPGYQAYQAEMTRRGWSSRLLAAGDRLALDGARILVRWPLPGRVPRQPTDTGTSINNVSIVLDVRYGERRLLLTGDVEEEIDRPLLEGGLTTGPTNGVDVLKVAHHGSGTATTSGFVAALAPRLAIVSAGAGNRYGHPNPDTIRRLESTGARVLRTDQDGSVTVTTDGRDLQVSTSGGRPVTSASAAPPATAFGCPLPAPLPVPPALPVLSALPAALPATEPMNPGARLTAGPRPRPRISTWSSRPEVRPPTSFGVSIRPAGSSATRSRWPMSPRSSVNEASVGASYSTDRPWRQPLSSMTSTRPSTPSIRSRAWVTAMPAPSG
ncbi:MAG: ComEC/Rec2 family competence protein [Chloroflexi bacterium]|nr:ComEC/Rec2 family competence protein [Chloroflexota bacterium]